MALPVNDFEPVPADETPLLADLADAPRFGHKVRLCWKCGLSMSTAWGYPRGNGWANGFGVPFRIQPTHWVMS